MAIAICMPAVIRPEIVERTLSTFAAYVKPSYPEWGLCINVDGLDEHGVNMETAPRVHIVNVARQYLPIARFFLPSTNNFNSAILRTWDAALETNPACVLYLEDDWEFRHAVDASRAVQLFEKYPRLAVLRLGRWNAESNRTKNWNKWLPWNGEYFEIPDNLKKTLGYSQNPTFFRVEFLEAIRPLLWDQRNLELEMKGASQAIRREIPKWDYGVFQLPNEPRTVADIGRRWRVDNGWKKEGRNGGWMYQTWERSDAKTK
jgi:hypothetical protein